MNPNSKIDEEHSLAPKPVEKVLFGSVGALNIRSNPMPFPFSFLCFANRSLGLTHPDDHEYRPLSAEDPACSVCAWTPPSDVRRPGLVAFMELILEAVRQG